MFFAKRIVLVAAVLGLLVTIGPVNRVEAQSQFVGEGSNAFFLTGGGGTGNDVTDLGAAVGFTLVGRVDMGIGLTRASFGDTDLSALSFSPFGSVTLLKQGKGIPFSLDIGGAYSSSSYSADVLDDFGWDMSESGYSVGGTIYGAINASPTTNVIPDFGVTYASTTATIEDSFGGETSAEADGIFFSFGSSVAVAMASGNVFNIRAGANVNEDGDARLTGTLGMTFVLPSGNN